MPLLLSPPSADASEPVVLSRPDPYVLVEVRALLDPVAPPSCLGTITGD